MKKSPFSKEQITGSSRVRAVKRPWLTPGNLNSKENLTMEMIKNLTPTWKYPA